MLFVGVGLNSSGLLLQEEVRLMVGFSGGGGGWFWGRSRVGAWVGLELCVGLQLTDDLKLLVQGMQGVIERVGLNNSGLYLLWAEVWLVVGLSGRGSGWFLGGVIHLGRGMS